MIHPSAVIAKNAEIHETTHIGPFCFIGDGVKIGENNNFPFLEREKFMLDVHKPFFGQNSTI